MMQPPYENANLAPLKRKVMMMAVMCGIVFIVSQIVMYFAMESFYSGIIDAFDGETNDPELEKSLQQLKQGKQNRLLQIMPGLIIGLLVPACGVYGAMHNKRESLLCFWGCNVCNACCGCYYAVMLMGIILLFRNTIAPAVEDTLNGCDPYIQCPMNENLPAINGLVDDPRTVDCLAANEWPIDYTRQYPNPGSMSSTCVPSLWLDCTDVPSGIPAEFTYAVFTPKSERFGAAFDNMVPKLTMTDRLGAMMRPARRMTIVQHRDAFGDLSTEDCKIDKAAYDSFHNMAIKFPEVYSRVEKFVIIADILQFISVCFAIPAFIFGKQLYDQVQSQHVVMMQPQIYQAGPMQQQMQQQNMQTYQPQMQMQQQLQQQQPQQPQMQPMTVENVNY